MTGRQCSADCTQAQPSKGNAAKTRTFSNPTNGVDDGPSIRNAVGTLIERKVEKLRRDKFASSHTSLQFLSWE